MIALGGNAIRSPKEKTSEIDPLKRISESLETVLTPELLRQYEVILSHGNGPQIGNIIRREEISSYELTPTSIDVCVAQTQGSLGYMLQSSAQNIFAAREIYKPVVTIVTQVIVDPLDPEFDHPTKPIGSFYDEMEAQKLRESMNWKMVEDAGRGYRRVIASPKPLAIVELATIECLVKSGILTIAVGGGGIPVIRQGDRLRGIDAVIDKDLASALLANSLHCHTYVILTAVDFVQTHFRTENPVNLKRISLAEIRQHFAKGEFPAGSMGPKIAAAIQFLENGGQEVIISSAQHFPKALGKNWGTHIVP
jgi:carbamate kinase